MTGTHSAKRSFNKLNKGKNNEKAYAKKKIFTLIELLIVVAIIAILAGMLLPALNAARDKAKAIQCSGNFSSIGKAAMMYAADWHDYLPPGSNGDNSSDPNRKRLWGTGNTGAIA